MNLKLRIDVFNKKEVFFRWENREQCFIYVLKDVLKDVLGSLYPNSTKGFSVIKATDSEY